MAFNPIETDYRPNFGLGAYYQGINAANAKQLTEEDILKAFLANQKEQNEQPLDLMVKQWQATHAQDQMNSPEYRQAMLDGYIGQMKSQIAAGRKAMETVGTDIPAINQENKNKLFMGKVLSDWNANRLGQEQPQGNIGFTMQPQEQVSPIGNISKQSDMLKSFGTDYKTAPDMPAANYMINEINRGLANLNIKPKDKQDLLKEKQRILSELNGQPPVLSNMIKEPQEQPQDNILSKLQNILVNTPEHIQAINKIRAMDENQLNVADTRGQYLLQAALARLQKTNEKPLTLDQAVARSQRILAGQEEGDKQAAEILITNSRNYKLSSQAAAWQGNNLNLPATQQTGQIQNSPSAVEQAGLLTGDNTRRNEALRNRTTSGNKFTIEKTP